MSGAGSLSDTADFLLELFTEELPPKPLPTLSAALGEGIAAGLNKANLSFDNIQCYATPRRLAVLVSNLQTEQATRQEQRRGPAVQAAFTADGDATPAALGFAKSCGVGIDELTRLKTDKGEWLAYDATIAGAETKLLLADIIKQALKKLPIPRPMRWSDNGAEFIRPVHGLIMLLGDVAVPGEILGLSADRITYGHRIHSEGPISIAKPSDYVSIMEQQGKVIVDFAKRKQAIADQAKAVAAEHNAEVVLPDDLLDEVTALVEWPVALCGSFDAEFLRVPNEALIAAMHQHQKSFHCVDAAGKMLPKFIFIANLASQKPEVVVEGNQKVMTARLSDAKFFYESDLKQPLESRLTMLQHVTYQAKLGSLHDKATRTANLAHDIAQLIGANADAAARAGMLAKCDLVSGMVEEFPELQGIIGYYYASHDAESPAVATAIKEMYLPAFAGDAIPASEVGKALALAERIDTLVGIFGINQQPTGVKDPFKLRRAALGVVRIVIEAACDLDIKALLQTSAAAFEKLPNQAVVAEVQQFIIERMRAWYLERGVTADVFNAVLAKQDTRLLDFDKRIQAVMHFNAMAEAQALAAANKRVSRILQKQTQQIVSNGIDQTLLQEAAEKDLAELVAVKRQAVEPLFAKAEYKQALIELAQLRGSVDSFFDDVMVMVDDEKLRHNRLTLLASLRNLFLQVADISLLQQASNDN